MPPLSRQPRKQKIKVGKIIFEYKSGIYSSASGRKLSYVKATDGCNKFGRDGLTYEGSENKKWSRMRLRPQAGGEHRAGDGEDFTGGGDASV